MFKKKYIMYCPVCGCVDGKHAKTVCPFVKRWGVSPREQTTEVVNKNFELDHLLSRTSSRDRHLSPTFILVAYAATQFTISLF